jgi:tRNA dimethylallyltransferase
MDIYIVGPTASGKTDLSIKLAELLQCPILSADSRQCYIGMDIGTSKPIASDLARAQHFNISNLHLNQKDDAAAFVQRVNHWKIEHPHPNWIIVGGSTLYLQSLLYPLDDIPKSDLDLQNNVEQSIRLQGLQLAWDRLNELDPVYAKQMDGLNHQRIVRALCVCIQTGKPFSSFHKRDGFEKPDNAHIFGLTMERDRLIKQINNRVDTMISAGLVNEVKNLLDQGFDQHSNTLKTVGYAEVVNYISGMIDHKSMIDQIKAHTRQYSRRQMTWFRRWPFVEWIDLDKTTTSDAAIFVRDRLLSMETQRKLP